MPKRHPRGPFNWSNSQIVFLLGLCLTVFMSFNLVNAFQENQRIQARIDKLQTDLDSLQSENQELNESLAYTNTDLFVEEEARNLLNYKREGELVVSLPPEQADVAEQIEQAEQELAVRQEQANVVRWWEYFFGQ